MKKTSIHLLLMLMCLCGMNAIAQEKFDVLLRNDTVFNSNVPQFICEHKNKGQLDGYSLRTLEKKLQAVLIVKNDSSGMKFSGSFPTLGLRYACLYPKIEIITLLDSYLRNKVMVNGEASREGLQAYCKERAIPLDTMTTHKKINPATRDSMLIATAKADAASQVKFTFHNNASRPVKVFIGDRPKGGSGRIQVIAPHGDFPEHARKTEKIFLLDDAGNPIKSIAVTDQLTKVVIKASADDFE